MAEADINTPPAQDSPKNIVNILCDDCIQLVLLKLKKVNEFWCATQVCTRFQANAKACFPFKKVEFGYYRSHDHQDILLFESAEVFLSLFGPRIESIHCYFQSYAEYIGEMDNEENLRLISQYCGKTLIELELSDNINNFYVSNLNLRSSFHSLKKLKLYVISFFNFNATLMFPELQSLEMALISGPLRWFANKFPMLQYVEMNSVTSLNDDIFIEFQNRNPQLQSLHCTNCTNITPLVCENIGDRLPNIFDLCLNGRESCHSHLSTLRRLRKLQLLASMQMFPCQSKSFFSTLGENKQPIEKLTVRGVDIDLGIILQRLQTIKVLHIEDSPANVLFDLVKHLPTLEYLVFKDNRGISLLTVKKIIENCKKVKKIDIYNGLIIDRETYLNEHNSIVSSATGRVEIRFFEIFYSRIYVKEYIDLMERTTRWVQFTHNFA